MTNFLARSGEESILVLTLEFCLGVLSLPLFVFLERKKKVYNVQTSSSHSPPPPETKEKQRKLTGLFPSLQLTSNVKEREIKKKGNVLTKLRLIETGLSFLQFSSQ